MALKSLGESRRSLRADLRRSRPGGAARRGELAKRGVVPTRRTGEAPHQHQADRRLGRPGRTDLQHAPPRSTASTSTGTSAEPDRRSTNCLEYIDDRGGRLELRRPVQRRRTPANERRIQRSSAAPPARSAAAEQAKTGGTGALSGPAAGHRPGRRDRSGSRRSAKPRPKPRPKAPNRCSTTSWGKDEEPRRTTGSREQPDPGRGGDGAGRDRRRLPRLQRQQRPALRLHLQPQGAGAQRRRPGQRQRGADRRRPRRHRQVGGPGPDRATARSPPSSRSASTRAPNRCRSTRRSRCGRSRRSASSSCR